MRGLKRAFRVVDTLAELVIFDVLLATRKRRRWAAAIAVSASAALYAASGFLFIPDVEVPHAPLSSAPFVVDRDWKNSAWPIWEIKTVADLTPERTALLCQELANKKAAVDRVTRLVENNNALEFENTPDFRTLRDMSHLLNAKGVLHAKLGQHHEAVDSWLTALQLSRAIARGHRGASSLIHNMVAIAFQRRTLDCLLDHADRRGLTNAEAWLISAHLLSREVEGVPTLRSLIRIDAEAMDRGMAEAAALGVLSFDGDEMKLVRPLLPVRLADRVAFLQGVREDAVRACRAAAERVAASPDRPVSEEDMSEMVCGPSGPRVRFTAFDAARGLFSTERARKFAALVVAQFGTPNWKVVGERIDQIDARIKRLSDACDAVTSRGTRAVRR